MIPNKDAIERLAGEDKIVWVDGFNPAEVPYVREVVYAMARRRKGRLRYNGMRVVGWTELNPKAESRGGCFTRRIFWLADHDPYEGGGAPIEAVDPLTVEPGKPGELTERAWGRPFPPDIREGGAE